MPRHARISPGGLIYHVLNRGVSRQTIFERQADFAAFVRVLADVLAEEPIPVLGWCLMGNHWHLLLWPERDGQLARFMQRLTITHVRRWVEHRHRVGWGSLYQGRYKSFVVQDDEHFLTVLRYIERNPVRAGLVGAAEKWRWSSLGQLGLPATEQLPLIPITRWPVPRRADWAQWVNRPQTAAEAQALARHIASGRPFGSEAWTKRMEKKLAFPPERPRGRPVGWRKEKRK